MAVMLANASVVTARKSPLTRKAGSPTRTANSTPTAVPARRAANHGRSTVTVVMSPTKGRPMPSGWPRVKARVDRPPTPANANWPSESCPAHPVSIDNDTATMATTSNSVHTSICDGLAARTGTRRAGTNRASMPRVDRRRAHQRRSRRRGHRAWRTPTEKDTPSAERARDSRSTMTSTVTKRKALNTPTSRFRLTDTSVSAIPERDAADDHDRDRPHPGGHGDDQRPQQQPDGRDAGELVRRPGHDRRDGDLRVGGEPGGQPPHQRRHPTRADPDEAGVLGVVGHGADVQAGPRAVEEPAQPDEHRRDQDDERRLPAPDHQAVGDLDLGPRGVERHGDRRRPGRRAAPRRSPT